MVTPQTSVALGLTQTTCLDRYARPKLIRKRGSLVVVHTHRKHDRLPCVVLTPSLETEPAHAAEILSKIEHAHRGVSHRAVPKVVTKGTFQRRPFLELDCDAIMDGAELHRLLTNARRRAPLSAGFAFARELFTALSRVHDTLDPLTRKPLCLGRLSYSDILFSPSGRLHLLLFSHHPLPSSSDAGPTFQAPEVARGGEPSPMGDFVALHLLLRSLLSLVDFADEVVRVLRGDLVGYHQEILDCLRWPDLFLLAQPPARRGTRAEAEAVSSRLRELCGVRPDLDAFEAFVRHSIPGEELPASDGAGGHSVLVLGVETSWAMGPDGSRHMLGQAHRRIVTALAQLHRRSPGAVLTMHELLEAGWPGERPIPEAGANRVYVALTQLRRRGMRDLIERCDGGYRLVPDVQIRFAT